MFGLGEKVTGRVYLEAAYFDSSYFNDYFEMLSKGERKFISKGEF